MAKYRIVRDSYSGYEIQKRPAFWPFWYQVSRTGGYGCNTFSSLERAKEAIEVMKNPVIWNEGDD
jgi:hypothetical protein